MSADPEDDATASPDPRRIRLERGGAIVFEGAGFRIIRSRGLVRSPLHPYSSVTQVSLAARALLIGTLSGLLVVRTSDFVEPGSGPQAARDRLLASIAAAVDGPDQLQAMARLEALAGQKTRLVALWATVALCLVGSGFQLRDSLVDQIGAFLPELFVRGELWRAVTAHFLHALPAEPGFFGRLVPGLRGLPIHLAINVAGLVVLGPLVERPLGSWRTVLVLIFGGIGTVAGILVAGHHEVIGASGLVAALAGAILALELHFPDAVPCEWRIPRRLFLAAIVLQFGIMDPLLRNYVAGGAHLGGFVGGYGATWWLGAPDFARTSASLRLRLAAIAGIACAASAAIGIVPLARLSPAALERHAQRLLDSPASLHLFPHENAAAWFIATEAEPSETGLELAIALADRAVTTTERQLPGILDTLAEALFQSGDRLGAILTIDEAIQLVPWEPYFVEQRRRFTGERSATDRPPPPGSAGPEPFPFFGEDESAPFDPQAPRLTI
ncbi:MAG: rhomboid family intramembrane serine protease [Myxococcota bacterium]